MHNKQIKARILSCFMKDETKIGCFIHVTNDLHNIIVNIKPINSFPQHQIDM